jgi:hypothetical protein
VKRFTQKLKRDEHLLLREKLASLPTEVKADGEVTGRAADGTVVSLGNLNFAPKSLLSYLTTNPTPETWWS